jgi:integrase/recombinase XerD
VAPPKEATVEMCIERMEQDLAFAKYAKTTHDAYVRTARSLLNHVGRPVEQIGREELRGFVEHLMKQGRSASWLKMHLAAIVFLFTRTLGRPTEVSFIKFPRQHSPLPTVLSLDEVARVLQALRRPIYQTIAMVLYGAGLRIEEALSLEVGDVDGARGVLRIRHGKGDRAREVKLSLVLYQALRAYWARERPSPPYLFALRLTGRPPTQESVRTALAAAAEEAGIKKPVRPHVLRHSYATHLLDAGTDVRVIQSQLGHNSLQTTMRYTRVSTALVQKTPSPLDLLPSRGFVRR